ncbi:MAG: tetratricopeptide repeat protein, partial [Acidobacteriaceae bacterium]|nr:tetratricopeptide repeat protein [Acidobacteriaceae bacterium]
PGSAEAHTALGAVELDYVWDREAAARELHTALAINPGSAWAHHWMAHALEAQGRLPEAMTEMKKALEMDPLSIPVNWDVGTELLAARRYGEALPHINKSLELFPAVPLIAFEKAELSYMLGDQAAARATVAKLKGMGPEVTEDPFFLAFFGTAAVRDGRRQEGIETLKRLEALRRTRYVEPIGVLELCAEINDRKALQVWLDRAFEERSSMYLYLPLMKAWFRDDPEVDVLITNAAARTQAVAAAIIHP